MPKEIIVSRYDQKFGVDAESGKAVPLETTQVHVGWTKDREHVEVASLNPNVGDIHSPERGWFVQLDREGMNRLIRSLRKARDQAFGADA